MLLRCKSLELEHMGLGGTNLDHCKAEERLKTDLRAAVPHI